MKNQPVDDMTKDHLKAANYKHPAFLKIVIGWYPVKGAVLVVFYFKNELREMLNLPAC
ncbi:MAG: hypothetical protein KDC85_16565 [Saprospiraceae bacterium]|nr:hypothetical protein [Saprospiraceae bacterium]MCB9323854.1 hypothetical protein [Lewinellaceae bacterium]